MPARSAGNRPVACPPRNQEAAERLQQAGIEGRLRNIFTRSGTLILFLALFSALALGRASASPVPREAEPARPNFVVIQTDDQSLIQFDRYFRDLYDNRRQVMPKTMALMRDKGITFSQYMTPFPLCAPSRASLLSGRYAQNHGVIRIGGVRGGWRAWQNNEIMDENLPVWLQRAGYRTLHFGKFMNYYGGPDDPAETRIPPGWDRWVTDATDNSTREFYGYRQNIDGQITERLGWPWYGLEGVGRDPDGCPDLGLETCNYHTDSMSIQAEQAIRESDERPFYLQVDYHTPHGDSRPPGGPEPAARHYDTALRTAGPRPKGFNERDISDKPAFLQADAAKPLNGAEIRRIDIEFRKSIEALRSVDDGVGRIIKALRETGKLQNTYVIYTSDNGFFNGQHRISRGKLMPYEPALRVPFVIRGPGIRPRTISREPVANHDVAPTLLRLAGARAGYSLDGRSLQRFWQDPQRRSRRPLLLSSYLQITRLIPGDYPDEEPVAASTGGRAGISVKSPNQNYVGIRLGPYKYVRYEGGDRELYVLSQDPAELTNRASRPRYRHLVRYLDRQLEILRGCHAQACRNWTPKWPRPPG